MAEVMLFENVEFEGGEYIAYNPAIFMVYTAINDDGNSLIYSEEDLEYAIDKKWVCLIPNRDVNETANVWLTDSHLNKIAHAVVSTTGKSPYKLWEVYEAGHMLTFGCRTRTLCTPIKMAHVITDVFNYQVTSEEIALKLIQMACRLEQTTDKSAGSNGERTLVDQYKIFYQGNLVLYLTITEPQGEDMVQFADIIKFDDEFAERLGIFDPEDEDSRGWEVSGNYYMPQSDGNVIPYELTTFDRNGMN